MADIYNENFTFFWLLPNIFSCQQDFIVSSPEFSIDILNNGTFSLTLEYSKKVSMVAITLKRVFKSDLPENFHPVSMKASLFDPLSISSHESSWEEVDHAERLASIIQVVSVPDEVIWAAEESERELMVKFEVRLKPIDFHKYFKFLSSKSRSLRILSTDFSRMLIEGQFYDVIFKVLDTEFKAHRFILQGRAPKLYEMLKDENKKDTLLVRKVKNIQPSQFGILLNFIYSGTLQEASDLTQWSVIDFLLRNQVIFFEDKRCLLSNGCIAKSSLTDEKIFYIWNLDLKVLNLSFMPSFRLLHTNHLCGETFLLSIWETTDLYNEKYLRSAIQLYNLSKGSILYARIEIGIFDKDMYLHVYAETVHTLTSNCEFYLPSILSRDISRNKNLIVNGNLKILYKIFLCQDRKVVNGHSNKLRNKYLEDMNRIRETKFCWDLKLVYSNDVLYCHKPILMARSPVLKDTLMDERNHFINWLATELYFDDTNAGALSSFLNYLYTGEVEDYKYRKYLKLYNLANIYKMHDLKKICKESLISGVKLRNALELLELSHKYSDSEMTTKISKFISSHYKQFVHSKAFAKAVKEKPDLIIEIARNSVPKPDSAYASIK